MVSERARNAFLTEGLRLDFVEESSDTPMNWVETDIYFDQDVKSKRSSSERVVTVYLPCIYSPASDHPLSSGGRFYGAFYCKCPSLAWMVEWILGGFARFK
jgi:hypothetical protein